MNYDEFLELVKSRRSVRRFKPDPVPEEYIDKLLEAARWAPSGFNMQPWEFVVVRDQALKEGIARISEEIMALHRKMEVARESWQTVPRENKGNSPFGGGRSDISQAPVFIVVLGDTRVNQGLPMSRRYDPLTKNLAYISGLAGAMLYMHLAATTLGLASRWVSTTSTAYGNCMVKELLGIPLAYDIYDMMALGFADAEPQQRLVREKQDIVHHDYCGENAFRTDEAVREFIVKIRNP